MCGCLLHAPYWGPGRNPGMCPDWESNQRPFGLQVGAQSTEPHQPGLMWVSVFCFEVATVSSVGQQSGNDDYPPNVKLKKNLSSPILIQKIKQLNIY